MICVNNHKAVSFDYSVRTKPFLTVCWEKVCLLFQSIALCLADEKLAKNSLDLH